MNAIPLSFLGSISVFTNKTLLYIGNSSFHYQIYDLNGRLHDNGNTTVNPSKIFRISANNLERGYYLARIRHQNGNEVLKFYKD